MRALLSRLSLLATACCVVVLCLLHLLHEILDHVLLRTSGSIVLTIEDGMTARAIYQRLSVVPLGVSCWQWLLVVHMTGLDRHLQPGRYVVYAGEPLSTVLNRLQQGRSELLSFHISPGDTLRQIRDRLNHTDTVRHDTVFLSDKDIAHRLGLFQEKTLEGYLMPDTYFYSVGTSDWVLIRYAASAMQSFLTTVWPARDRSIPLQSLRETLVMASLIEKEAALITERNNVASVFYNRIRLGMRLQTDPSVAYTMGHEGRIRKSDLRNADDPYNTYRRMGLPPSAICFPSKSAILAALHPAHSAYLYFVARGDGTTFFSKDLRTHIIAVNRYQRRDTHHVRRRRHFHHLRRD